MVVLDAYALIALLTEEPAADETASLMESRDAAMTAVNIAEAVDVLQRVYGVSRSELDGALEQLVGDALTVLAAGEVEGRRAGTLRASYYRRRSRPISLADCFLLVAAGPDDSVATADPHVADVAGREQIDVVALPDSAGRRP